MGTRRKAREFALQFLFQAEFIDQPAGPAFESFCGNFEINKKSIPYARKLALGVREKWEEINSLINQYADNWRLERMSVIDRNIIRLAVFELYFLDDVPVKVAINEAVEIAKRYGTDESGPFINGILDAIQKSM